MSTLSVDTITEKTTGNGVQISGHIVQGVNAINDVSSQSTTSTTFVDTGLSATITPASTDSKILILASFFECYSASSNTAVMFQILRGSTVIGDHNGATLGYTDAQAYHSVQIQFTDSPSTTSAVTYKIQYKSNNGNSVSINSDNTATHLQLLEIGG